MARLKHAVECWRYEPSSHYRWTVLVLLIWPAAKKRKVLPPGALTGRRKKEKKLKSPPQWNRQTKKWLTCPEVSGNGAKVHNIYWRAEPELFSFSESWPTTRGGFERKNRCRRVIGIVWKIFGQSSHKWPKSGFFAPPNKKVRFNKHCFFPFLKTGFKT